MAKKFRGAPGGGMGNMQGLLKQAQKMQKEMEKNQQDLKERVYEVQTGGGAVKLSINGNNEIQSLVLSEDVVDPDDIEMLQDLIIAAFTEAFQQIDKETNELMGSMTGGMNIPGLF